MNLTFLGSGSFGTALAVIFSQYNFNIKMYDRNADVVLGINRDKRNIKYLKNITIPEKVMATNDIDEAIYDSDIIFLSVPSQAIREISRKIHSKLKSNSIMVCLSKGIELTTYKRLSEVLEEEFPNNPIVVLSGPSHAEEVSKGVPTAMVIASEDRKIADELRDIFMNENLRVYTSEDVKGVELRRSSKKYHCILCWNCSRDWIRRQFICCSNHKRIMRNSKTRSGTRREK